MNSDNLSTPNLKSDFRGMLVGQKALVTGGSSGIGRAVAISFAEAGAEVVINFIGSQEAADEVVATIQKMGTKVVPVRADVGSEDQDPGMFKKAIEELGTIDILVNNAGIHIDAPIDKMTIEQWNSVISTNLTGQFLCAREAIREFKRRGVVSAVSASAGKIICMSSVHEVIPWGGR